MDLPVKLKPKHDEILSSWIVRLAMAHGTKVHSFCALTLPQKSIWNRDIDKGADEDLMRSLSLLTGTNIETVRQTTLSALEGFVYEKHNKYGPTSWILPVGVYHRKRVGFGMQYCSLCLSEDENPYFRLKWRFAFVVVCEKHGTLLRDRCPRCSTPINFHRGELGTFKKYQVTSLTLCCECNEDIRLAPAISSIPPVEDTEIIFTRKLLTAAIEGSIRINNDEVVYSFMYFLVLNQVMKILIKKDSRVTKLRDAIQKETRDTRIHSIDFESLSIHADIQEQSLPVRRQLLFYAGYLLENWPNRFIELSRSCKAWSSLWLRNLEEYSSDRSRMAPFWI